MTIRASSRARKIAACFKTSPAPHLGACGSFAVVSFIFCPHPSNFQRAALLVILAAAPVLVRVASVRR